MTAVKRRETKATAGIRTRVQIGHSDEVILNGLKKAVDEFVSRSLFCAFVFHSSHCWPVNYRGWGSVLINIYLSLIETLSNGA